MSSLTASHKVNDSENFEMESSENNTGKAPSQSISIITIANDDQSIVNRKRVPRLRHTKSFGSKEQNEPESKEELERNGEQALAKIKVRQTRSCESASEISKQDLPKAVVYPMIHESVSECSGESKENKVAEADSGFPKKLGSPPVFDPYDEAYMANACCECMHYRTGTIFVAIAELTFIVIWIALVTYYHVANIGTFELWLIILQALLCCVFVASILLLLAGVSLEKRSFVLPHIGLQVLGIGVALALTFLTVVVMACGNNVSETVYGGVFGLENLPKIEHTFGPIWPFCLAAIFDFFAAVGIWFYVVVKGYYDYLSDRDLFERLTNNRAQSTPTMSKVLPSWLRNWLDL